MQDTFEMLEELLEQEQFELLFPKENGAQAEWECYETYESNEGKQGEKDSLARVGKEKIPGDIRLVYLMNDAVESFLIFRDARLTGSYLENYEGPLKSSLSQEGDEYILVVWQGENVVALLLISLHGFRPGSVFPAVFPLLTAGFLTADQPHFQKSGQDKPPLRFLFFR